MAQQRSPTSTIDEQSLRMTYEEFLAWAGEETRAEWVDGEVILLEMPNTIHQEIILFLARLAAQFADLFKLGRVYVAPYDMHMAFVRALRQPDLVFVGHNHLDRITADRLEGPADLAVEVISPDSVLRDTRDKLLEYQQAGVPEYWIIDPRERRRTVEPYVLTDRGIYRPIPPDDRGRLHSVVLPGFWLDPGWLWQEPMPDPLILLATMAPDAFRKAVGEITTPEERERH